MKKVETKSARDKSFAREKLSTYEKHIAMLSEDNARLHESLKVRRDQLNSNSIKQIQAKNNLIKELTLKLKESTRVI